MSYNAMLQSIKAIPSCIRARHVRYHICSYNSGAYARGIANALNIKVSAEELQSVSVINQLVQSASALEPIRGELWEHHRGEAFWRWDNSDGTWTVYTVVPQDIPSKGLFYDIYAKLSSDEQPERIFLLLQMLQK